MYKAVKLGLDGLPKVFFTPFSDISSIFVVISIPLSLIHGGRGEKKTIIHCCKQQ